MLPVFWGGNNDDNPLTRYSLPVKKQDRRGSGIFPFKKGSRHPCSPRPDSGEARRARENHQARIRNRRQTGSLKAHTFYMNASRLQRYPLFWRWRVGCSFISGFFAAIVLRAPGPLYSSSVLISEIIAIDETVIICRTLTCTMFCQRLRFWAAHGIVWRESATHFLCIQYSAKNAVFRTRIDSVSIDIPYK